MKYPEHMTVLALALAAGMAFTGVAMAQESGEDPENTEEAPEAGEDTTEDAEAGGAVGSAVSEAAQRLQEVEGRRDEQAQELRNTALENNEGFQQARERSGGAADAALGLDRPGRPETAGRPDFARPDVGRPDFTRPERPSRPEFAGRPERPDNRPPMPEMPERPAVPNRPGT